MLCKVFLSVLCFHWLSYLQSIEVSQVVKSSIFNDVNVVVTDVSGMRNKLLTKLVTCDHFLECSFTHRHRHRHTHSLIHLLTHSLTDTHTHTHTHTFCPGCLVRLCIFLFLSTYVCLPVYLSFCLSAWLPICLSVFLPACLSVYLLVILSACLPVCLFCLSVYLLDTYSTSSPTCFMNKLVPRTVMLLYIRYLQSKSWDNVSLHICLSGELWRATSTTTSALLLLLRSCINKGFWLIDWLLLTVAEDL